MRAPTCPRKMSWTRRNPAGAPGECDEAVRRVAHRLSASADTANALTAEAQRTQRFAEEMLDTALRFLGRLCASAVTP